LAFGKNKIKIKNMAAIDWAKIYEKYKGLWIALDEKEKKVIAFDKEAKKAFEKARKKGVKIPILFKVPSEIIPYVGTPFWV
jgi:hypothetical protein